MKIAVIIAAAGCAIRMGGGGSKALLLLNGRPALGYSLDIFTADPLVRRIVVAARPADMAALCHICLPYQQAGAVIDICAGGDSRAASVAAALQLLATDGSLSHIAVHDAARPLLHEQDWRALQQSVAAGAAAAVLAATPVDSIKQTTDGRVSASLPRAQLAATQTPQLFEAALLRRAYAQPQTCAATDDAELVQALGCAVSVVWAQQPNFKLTFAPDIAAAQAVLKQREQAVALADDADVNNADESIADGILAESGTALDAALASLQGLLPACRIGQGWDSHRLVAGRRLILGGVEIEHQLGLLGHSDADVLLHAIIDALLGAAGLPDIGRQFPDSDPAYAGVSSLLLLRRCNDLLRQAGWRVRNLDATVIAQQPRLSPYCEQMRGNIAQALQLPPTAISVKAKSAEGLDSVGRGEAMQAVAAALLEPCPTAQAVAPPEVKQ